MKYTYDTLKVRIVIIMFSNYKVSILLFNHILTDNLCNYFFIFEILNSKSF